VSLLKLLELVGCSGVPTCANHFIACFAQCLRKAKSEASTATSYQDRLLHGMGKRGADDDDAGEKEEVGEEK